MTHLNLQNVRNRLGEVLQPHTEPLVSAYQSKDYLTLSKLIGLIGIKAIFVVAAIGMAWLVFTHLPVSSVDWVGNFRPAALQWQDPYYRPGLIFNPPWLFPLLYPLAVLPRSAGIGMLIMLSVLAIGLYVKSPIKLLFVMASVSMATVIALGQLDALLLYGLMIPSGLGIPLLLLKPQGVFLAILPRLNRWSVLFTLLVFVVSVLIWGDWWTNVFAHRPNPKANMSLFPYTIPLGILLAYFGLKRKSDALLCSASLCFAPYFMAQSMLPAIAATIRETNNWRWWTVTVVGTWLYMVAMKSFLW
jgi:hypothetical protein